MSAQRFVSLPVTVEAMQVAKPYKAVAEWSGGTIFTRGGVGNAVHAIIVGDMWAQLGDWIVLNPDNTLTVMSDGKFQSSYRKATQ